MPAIDIDAIQHHRDPAHRPGIVRQPEMKHGVVERLPRLPRHFDVKRHLRPGRQQQPAKPQGERRDTKVAQKHEGRWGKLVGRLGLEPRLKGL